MLSLRPFERDDLPLLARWLAEPHVAEWWGPPPDDVNAKYDPRLDENANVRMFVACEDGRAVGMVQTYLVSDHPEWEELVGLEPGVAGVDLLLGEPDAIGRGLGPELLNRVTQEIVFADPAVHACAATVEVGNARSRRAFARAGFREVRDVVEDGRPHVLVRLDRAG